MSTETTASTAPKTERQARLQRAAAKVNGKPTATKGPKKFHGVECPNGKFWNEKRVAIVKALRTLGASSATAARPATDIVKKGKDLEVKNVVRYCHDAEPLVQGGIVKKASIENQPATCYYLTALGQKCEFNY